LLKETALCLKRRLFVYSGGFLFMAADFCRARNLQSVSKLSVMKYFSRLLFAPLLVLFATQAGAQSLNKDSLSLATKINSDRDKLAKMQTSLSDKEKLVEESASQAQESADANRKAADRLSDDPQDKRLAKKARKSAGVAKDDSKRARDASDELDNLRKDIRSLSHKIEKEETKLKKYTK
jgi:hypothetical protein